MPLRGRSSWRTTSPSACSSPSWPGMPEAEVELGADLQRDRRLEEDAVDADVERAALDHVAALGDARPGLEPDGDAGLAAARHLEQLVQAGVPEHRVGLARGSPRWRRPRAAGRASAWNGCRLTATMAAGTRVGILAQLADRARGVRQGPVDHDQARDERAHRSRCRRRGRGRRSARCRCARGRCAQVVAQVRRRDDEDLGHGGHVAARV